jgi:hypothetical protein
MRLPGRKPREDPPPDPRCTATTRAGRRCKLPAAWRGAPFCLLHMPNPPGRVA